MRMQRLIHLVCSGMPGGQPHSLTEVRFFLKVGLEGRLLKTGPEELGLNLTKSMSPEEWVLHVSGASPTLAKRTLNSEDDFPSGSVNGFEERPFSLCILFSLSLQ